MSQDKRAFNWDSIPVKTGVTADPAANAFPVAITIPAGKRWRLLSCSYGLTTDANAGDRYQYLVISHDGTNASQYYMSTLPQTANIAVLGWNYSAGAVSGGAIAAGLQDVIGIGQFVVMEAGATFQCCWMNKQAGDNASVMRYVYQEVPV